MKRLQAGILDKLDQWEREARNNAARAILSGRSAVCIVYPTGKKMMRFAEPFTDYGMGYEVPEETWSELGGKQMTLLRAHEVIQLALDSERLSLKEVEEIQIKAMAGALSLESLTTLKLGEMMLAIKLEEK